MLLPEKTEYHQRHAEKNEINNLEKRTKWKRKSVGKHTVKQYDDYDGCGRLKCRKGSVDTEICTQREGKTPPKRQFRQ